MRRLHTGEVVTCNLVSRHVQLSASTSVVIGVVGDDVLATPQGSGNERRKTTDGAGRGGTASDVSICP